MRACEQEVSAFAAWAAQRQARIVEYEKARMAAVEEEEEEMVGPTLPSIGGGGKGGNFGGFLLPGEGDRRVGLLSRILFHRFILL